MLRDDTGRTTRRFTLQWHLTHACELHCRHCYDRTKTSALGLGDCLRILDELVAFCKARHVRGSVSFSGGDPFLYPPFFEVYRAAVERKLGVSILGNPVDRDSLDKLVAIARPSFFQISLEGLEEQNDQIRGPGTFRKAMEFLPVLAELEIPSVVMLTLTRANIHEVIPLARLLRGRTGRFTFSRLAQVGEGANLESPSRSEYGELAMSYLVERRSNPSLGLKDNLFNIVLHELGMPLTFGCTGHGCGAAFDFMALLPGGDAHACRKFPSPIGNVLEAGLASVYDSAEAAKFRRGCAACDGCAIRKRCGGCLAVSYGQGLDPLSERDPHCFIDELAGTAQRIRQRPPSRGSTGSC